MNPEARRKARLWLLLIFLLGGAIGAVFGYSFRHRSYAASTTTKPPMSEAERRAKRVADITKELGLNAEQSAKVDSIIHGAHEEMKTIRDKARDKADAEVDVARQKARGQIREILTPEQKPKFDAMTQRMDEEKKKQMREGKK
jgi:Spy/CpxP family protein refolding chaperone